jgi:hypothetical protein
MLDTNLFKFPVNRRQSITNPVVLKCLRDHAFVFYFLGANNSNKITVQKKNTHQFHMVVRIAM